MRKLMLGLLILGVGAVTSFSNPILAGDVLIRQGMESENFETTVQGWRVERDGSAEFQNLVARGDVEATKVDVSDGISSVVIDPSQFAANNNQPIIFLSTGHADETDEGTIRGIYSGTTGGSHPGLFFESPEINGDTLGTAILQLQGVSKDGSEPKRVTMNAPILNVEMRAREDADHTDEIVSEGSFTVESNPAQHVFVAPPSGEIKYHLMADMLVETNPVANIAALLSVSFEIREGGTLGSGTIFLSGNSHDRAANCRHLGAGSGGSQGSGGTYHRSGVVTGLTPGDTYNIQTTNSLIIDNGGNADMPNRKIIRRSLTIEPNM